VAALPVETAIGALLARVGREAHRYTAEPLPTGGNNRVFRVTAGSERFVAKWYYHDARDPRDRLHAEFSFLEHVWGLGLRCVARPLACDRDAHVAIYEYIEGRRVTPEDLDEARVVEAARFFAALNQADSRSRAAALPVASEACFSVAEHLSMVDARLGRFAAMPVESRIDEKARGFVEALRRRWSDERARIAWRSRVPEEPLPDRWRCLSPSDFGFHNTRLRPDGQLCFFDFEYAGWDDPAKAFGDFFAHPGVPVPQAHAERFATEAAAPFENPEALIEHARLLEPVFRVKWCCIILNEFLPEAAERRRFADPASDPETRKQRQLDKARQLLATLTP
jgi:hypothetical protein